MKNYISTNDHAAINKACPFGENFEVGLSSTLDPIINPKTGKLVERNDLLAHPDSWEVLINGEVDFSMKQPGMVEFTTFCTIPNTVKSALQLADYIEKTSFDVLFPQFDEYLNQ